MNKADVVHHIEGRRLRLKVPHRRHNHAYFHELKERLNAIDVVEARVNPATASVLIHYTGSRRELLNKMVDTGVDKLLDLELGPLGEVAGAALPTPAKLALLVALVAVGFYGLEL
jgi:hypothetical protein